MTGQCCVSGAESCRPARRLSKAAAPLLPLLVLLPKCPMCLAAWLALATGIGFTATGAAWLQGTLAVLSLAAVAIAAASIIRRRSPRRDRAELTFR